MKKTISSIIVSIVWGVALTQGHAQSLKELINIALEKNYQIQILKNESQIATNNNTAGNAGQLPSVGIDGTLSTALNNTRQVFADGTVREGSNASTSNINLALMANWTVFNGFKVYARKDQLSYLEQIGEVNTKFYIEQTIADIAQVYYQLVYEEQLINNYRQSMKISGFRLQLEKQRKHVGVGKAGDYQLALVDYQSDSIKVLAKVNEIKSLQIQLNKILVNNPENEVLVDDTTMIESLTSLDKEAILSAAKESNSTLEQSKLEELVAETALRIKKAESYPKVDVFAGVEYSKSFAEVGFINTNRNLGPVAGVNVSFNLFNGGNTNREIRNATLSLQNTALSKENVMQEVNADVLSIYYQYESVRQRLVLAEGNVKAAEKVYSIAREQLKNGVISGYDFRITQQTLLNAELTLSQLQYALRSLNINLKRLTGEAVESFL